MIWNALTTPNEGLINIFSIPLTFIEITVAMLLFTTILNINCTKKQKILFVFFTSTFSIMSNTPPFYNISKFINALAWPIIAIITLKTTLFKSIFAEIIPFICIAILEPIIVKLLTILLNITYIDISSILIYRILFVVFMYLCMFVFFLIAKHLKFSIALLDDMNRKNKNVLLLNFICGVISIVIQLYLSNLYNDLHLITLFGTTSLLIYFLMSIYSLIRTTKLEITEQTLEETQLYNKSLKILHDNVRAFKHDFGNIVQSIGRLYRFK